MSEKKPLVIIGQRMGGGAKIAKGIEMAGGTAYVIPGVLADMKLGDVMKDRKSTRLNSSHNSGSRMPSSA